MANLIGLSSDANKGTALVALHNEAGRDHATKIEASDVERLKLEVMQQRDDTRTVTAADQRYRTARGTDIVRGCALASSGLTGRPPAMCANVRQSVAPRDAARSIHARPGGPQPGHRVRQERSKPSPLPLPAAIRRASPPMPGSRASAAPASVRARATAPDVAFARSARSRAATATPIDMGSALRASGTMPSQASNSVLQRWRRCQRVAALGRTATRTPRWREFHSAARARAALLCDARQRRSITMGKLAPFLGRSL
jgi:hypothetical protein